LKRTETSGVEETISEVSMGFEYCVIAEVCRKRPVAVASTSRIKRLVSHHFKLRHGQSDEDGEIEEDKESDEAEVRSWHAECLRMDA
jgi:hypothetical protein